jgi:hypothetical protein
MPPRKNHLEFDERLRKNNVICDDTYGDTVHARMDKHVKTYGADHRELDYFHSDTGIRDFIHNIVNSLGTIYQSTATDYVRIAYGHLCLDYMASKLRRKYDCDYEDLNWRQVYTRTWRYFKYRGFHRTLYRERES